MGQKCRIIRQNTTLFESYDLKRTVSELPVGTELDFGKVIERNGIRSVPVTVNGGRKGFIPADVNVVIISNAILQNSDADAYEHPSAGSSVVARLKKGERFITEDLVETLDGNWVKIRLADRRVAYIPGSTRVSYVRTKSGRNPHKDMVYGALLCIGGIVFTVYSSAASLSGGGSRLYFVWAAILFGALQFFIGWRRSSKDV